MTFTAEDDRRHQLKWTNNLQVGSLSFFLDYVYSSGRPYLALNQLNAEIDRINFASQDFLTNLPAYQRFDLGMEFQFRLGKYQASAIASCFNITNHQNVKYLQQVFSIPLRTEINRMANTIIGTETSLLDRTPNVGFRINF